MWNIYVPVSYVNIEVEGIQGAGPQNFILVGWLPQNKQTMMIILHRPILPSALLPLPPFDSYKDQLLIRLPLVILFLYLILVLHLEKRLTILDGELCHHRTCLEHIAVPHDVVVVDLGEDPPIFFATYSASHDAPSPLHHPLLRRSTHILGTLDFFGVSNIPLVCLDLLTWVQEMTEHFVEYFNISALTRGVGTLDPHQVPPQDTHAHLIAEGGLPGVLVGCECIPFCRRPLLGDTEVSPIDCHETVVEDISLFLTVEVDLWFRVRRGGRGCEVGYEKKCNFLTPFHCVS